MASGERYPRAPFLNVTNDMPEAAQGESSPDSDSGSEPNSGYISGSIPMSNSSHGVKRGGNNHFGSTGILKCLPCRKRKGKVFSAYKLL